MLRHNSWHLFFFEAGLELAAILSQPPKCWDFRHMSPHQPDIHLLKEERFNSAHGFRGSGPRLAGSKAKILWHTGIAEQRHLTQGAWKAKQSNLTKLKF